jgi:Retrotransposon gag protein
MVDRDAAEFLTLYLRGDAMTWWRSYCTTNGGLTNVFANKSFQDLLTELRSEFSDVDCEMQLRVKLFNIR